MAIAEDIDLPCLVQSLERILADRLQHPVAVVGVPDEALVDKRLQRVQSGRHDILRCIECRAAGEDRQAREEVLLGGDKKLIAPFDRPTQGSLALRKVTSAAGQKREALVDSCEELLRREDFDSRGREFQRKRQVVQPPADLGNRVLGREARLHRSGSGDEEADCFLVLERRHRILLLAREAQRLAARDEQVEPSACGEKIGQLARCIHDLLEVVEQEQE